jgi:glycosyltransferase involved in cell wall biosynthesis
VLGGHAGRGPVVQRVLRPGRRRGPGQRHPRRRGRGRRTDHDGHSGLLVDTHDPRDWAAALRRIVVDDDLRLRLEAGAVEQARRFSWERTAERTLEVYLRARADLRQPA